MTVEILFADGCPYAGAARALVRRCLGRLGLEIALIERIGDYPSPTVLVDGRDVMGQAAGSAPACRLDLPTEARVLEALASASAARPGGGGR